MVSAAKTTGFEVPEGPYETLAGYVLNCLGHLPQPSEMVVIAKSVNPEITRIMFMKYSFQNVLPSLT